ncbi:MAG: hypothetical protein AB1545_00145 [Thermodesulfobacteriota bacterium]|jgi:hypothetical protein
MEINGNSGGAALYAMKQAMKMPEAVVDLLKKSGEDDQQPLAAPKPTDPKAADIAKMTGKGGNINVVA